MSDRIRLATASLAGCFGCHMSLLDLDLQLVELLAHIQLDRTPLTDIKQIGTCDLGLIEGGVCNAENVEVLREFRRHCKTLVAVGACAINGGIPAMRNQYTLSDCLQEAYLHGSGIDDPQIPDDPELPLLLDQVHPIHDVVWVDYFLPGCPPSADTIYTFLQELLNGNPIRFAYQQIHYD
ncbi:MAG: NADP oxidoreductase [Sedimenticola sp.]|nr:NADP oxidoreductase [Sedimenticola sp.]